ncbi:MAG: extensin family [Beijerinckiaceae bacterium]|nr:MAG: extensin family [Beijerinckiaceae bacterium]
MLRFGHPPLVLARLSRLLLVVTGVGVLISGCGFARFEPREPWRAEAEAACMRSGIVKQSAYIRPTKPIDGPGPCGSDLPLKVAAFQNDSQSVALALASTGATNASFATGIVELTVLKPEATLGCPMVAWTDDWIATAVQPAAIAWLGQGVREIRTGGSYACRRRNHNPNAKLSEHAYGNAIDVMSFVLNDGNVVTVKGGWRGTEQEQGFLRDVFHGACQRFKTVLGPGSDALHYDHFHLDLAHHDARGQRRYCKPQVAAPQRPMPGVNPWGGPQNAYAFSQSQQPAYPQQMANGAQYNRPPQPYGAQPPYAPRPAGGTPLPAANTGLLARQPDPQDGEFRQDNEIEPDFDPKQFDLATGSIPDLPRPRGNLPAPRTQPVEETEYVPAPKPAPRRAATPSNNRLRLPDNPKGN